MKSVLEYFTGKSFSLAELDKITKRKDGKWTATCQILPYLYDLGLKVKAYSRSELEPCLEGEPYLRRMFGADADKVLQFIDVPVFVESVQNSLKYDLWEKKILTLPELEDHLKEGRPLIVVLDWGIVLGRNGRYQGHTGILVGFDQDSFYFQNSGPLDPQPEMPIPKELFLKAWSSAGAENDVIVVYGKR